jgi:hypothetical protein
LGECKGRSVGLGDLGCGSGAESFGTE